MLQGAQTWVFPSRPVILATATVGGPFEAAGPLARDFDILHDDLWLGQDSFEKAEKKLLEEACLKAIEKAGKKKEEIDFFLSGDLDNQIISSTFTARTLHIPKHSAPGQLHGGAGLRLPDPGERLCWPGPGRYLQPQQYH